MAIGESARLVTMIESRTLAYFVGACQHHHLAQAAAELGVAPSTLTMALKSLEADIGVPLFNASKAGHVPTPQGLRLFQAATRALHGERFFRAHAGDVRQRQIDKVVVRHQFYFTLGVFAKAASRAIDKLQPCFPSTFIEPIWHTGDRVSAELSDATMITIGYDDETTAAGWRTKKLLTDPWVLAREFPSHTSGSPSVDELLSGAIIVPSLPEPLVRRASKFIETRGLQNARFISIDPAALPQLASEAPHASFLLPSTMLTKRLGLMRIRAVPIGEEMTSQIVASYEGTSDVAEAYVSSLKEELEAGENNVVFQPSLSFRQLSYFSAMYECRTLTAAAKKLRIAQPALSSQLVKIEALTSNKLFDRHRDGLVPTAAGARAAAALAIVQPVIHLHQKSEFRVQKGGRDAIGIGVLPFADTGHPMIKAISKAILELKALHPHIVVQAVEATNDKLQELVSTGKLGVAVVDVDLPQMARFKLGPIEPMMVVANPRSDLIGQQPLMFSNLVELPLVLPSTSIGSRQILEDEARARGLPLRPALEINSLPLVKALVKDGLYATLLPQSIVQQELVEGTLRAYKLADFDGRQHAFVIYTTIRPLTPVERDFNRILQGILTSE